jgi:hypothetical protein
MGLKAGRGGESAAAGASERTVMLKNLYGESSQVSVEGNQFRARYSHSQKAFMQAGMHCSLTCWVPRSCCLVGAALALLSIFAWL